MKSWDSVRDAAGLYMQHQEEYKITGKCLRRRGSQLCQWACYLRLDMVLCVGEYGEH